MNHGHGMDRRRFLTVLGAGVAAAPLAACVSREDPYALVKPPVPGSDKARVGEEKWVTTACGQCAAGCGIRVRVVGGRAVKIEGHADNPINRGGIGPRGLSGLQVLYDPDRITQPLARSGGRGSGKLEPITWDAALERLTGWLAALRASGEPHRLAVISGRERGMTLDLWRRFCRAYGTPNLFDGLSRRMGAVAQASYLTRGVTDIPAYDWPNVQYVLSIGAGIMEASCQAISFARAGAHQRQKGARARIVQVEPSFSRTASRADDWISIVPGTHAAFVLGVAHVLVRDARLDADFVRDHCFGFEAWKDAQGRAMPGFKDVLQGYAPDVVSARCGVPAAVIERVAHDMADARPALALVDDRATLARGGLQVALAVSALNALLGAFERPGGVLTQHQPPVALPAEPQPDATAAAGLAHPRVDGAGTSRHPFATSVIEALPEALLAGDPYPVDTLLLHYSNPLYSGMKPDRWKAALAKVPHVVTFTPFLDETAAEVADLVLPDHTYLERWEDVGPAPSLGPAVLGVRQPVVEPQHDTRATTDVLLQVSSALGGSVAAALPWAKTQELIDLSVTQLQAAGRGSLVEDDAKAFRKKLLSEGFWAETSYPFEDWAHATPTPSGKFELFSQAAWARLQDLATREHLTLDEIVGRLGHAGDAALACLPHQLDDPARQGGAGGMTLEPYQSGTYAEGSGANLPLLQELVTVQGQVPWHTVVEIGAETARDHGLVEGDLVEVRSSTASLRARASLREGIRRDVVRIARGGGHAAFGRFAEGWGVNPMELLVPAVDPFSGVPALLGTRVSLEKVRT